MASITSTVAALAATVKRPINFLLGKENVTDNLEDGTNSSTSTKRPRTETSQPFQQPMSLFGIQFGPTLVEQRMNSILQQNLLEYDQNIINDNNITTKTKRDLSNIPLLFGNGGGEEDTHFNDSSSVGAFVEDFQNDNTTGNNNYDLHSSSSNNNNTSSCGCKNASCSHRPTTEHYHERRAATEKEEQQLYTIQPECAGEKKVIAALVGRGLPTNAEGCVISQQLHNIFHRLKKAPQPKNYNSADVVEELEEDDEWEWDEQMQFLAHNGGVLTLDDPVQPLHHHESSESSESSLLTLGEIKQFGFDNKKYIIFGIESRYFILPGTLDLLELMNTEFSEKSDYKHWHGYNCSYDHSTNEMTEFLVSSISAVAF